MWPFKKVPPPAPVLRPFVATIVAELAGDLWQPHNGVDWRLEWTSDGKAILWQFPDAQCWSPNFEINGIDITLTKDEHAVLDRAFFAMRARRGEEDRQAKQAAEDEAIRAFEGGRS